MRRARGTRLVGLAAGAALAVGACGLGPSGGSSGLSGSVLVSGSSTVGPITEIAAEDFAAQNPGVIVKVETTGTGGGFKDRFCTGEAHVNNASREIKDVEIERCAENGVTEILELRVAIDGITVLTSPDNDRSPSCLDFAEMYALVGPESADVRRWSDAERLVAELGGHATGEPFEDVPLATSGPGTESGTYDSFYELAIEDIAGERGIEDRKFRDDWTGNNDDNVIIQGIIGNPYSFGWVGFAFYEEVRDRVRAFEVAGEDGACVAPEAETIATGEYPLSRDLFLYVNLDELEGEDGAALEAFVSSYLTEVGRSAVTEAGYVPLTDEAWEQTRRAWQRREPNVVT